MISTWLRKLRAILGLGAVGTAVGALLGGGWALISSLVGGAPGSVIASALVWGIFGGFSATGFAVLTAGVARLRSLQDVGPAWAALAGGIAGALFPFALNLAIGGRLLPIFVFDLPLLGLFGVLGATLATGMVLVGARSDAPELTAPDDAKALPAPDSES